MILSLLNSRYLSYSGYLLLLLMGALPLHALGDNFIFMPQRLFAHEQSILLWFHEHLSATLQTPALILHYIGKTQNAIILTAIAALLIAWRYKVRYAALLILSAGLSAILMFLAKQFFNRPRPQLWPHIIVENGASFPSGHSTFSAAVATVFIISCWHTRHRHIALTVGILFALSMGLSRMLLGVHYPTDILAGWATGTMTTLGIYMAMCRYLHLRF